jgi:hypothetical protein
MLEAGVGSPFRIESREGVKMILDEHRIDWASDRVTVPGYRGHDHFWDRAMSRGVLAGDGDGGGVGGSYLN